MNSSSNLACSLHNGIRKTLFCNECDRSICFLCQKSSDHNDHSFSYLNPVGNCFKISVQEVRDNIKNREESKLKLEQDLNELFNKISKDIKSHGARLIINFTDIVEKKVEMQINNLKELQNKELKSYTELTDTFISLLNANDKSNNENVEFYSRDLLSQFLADKPEINIDFIPSDDKFSCDLGNFGHFNIDGKFCVSDLNGSADKESESTEINGRAKDKRKRRRPNGKTNDRARKNVRSNGSYESISSNDSSEHEEESISRKPDSSSNNESGVKSH